MRKAGWDLHLWEEAEKEERFSHPGKVPHHQGDQSGKKGSFRGSEERAKIGCGRQDRERPTQTVMPSHCAFHPETCVCWYVQGLGAGTRGLEDRPRD